MKHFSFIFWLVIVLILLRLIVLSLALNNIPPTEPIVETWWFEHGGDEQAYFNQAKNLAQFNSPGAGLIGFPLFLAPFIWLFKPVVINDLATPIVFSQTIVFYVLVSLLVYWLSRQFFKKKAKAKALTIVGLFNLYPYFLYYGLGLLSQSPIVAGYIKSRFLQLSFLLLLSDPLSTVLVLTCLFLFFSMLKKARGRALTGIVLGFLAGWAAVTRLQLALVLPFFGLALFFLAFRDKLNKGKAPQKRMRSLARFKTLAYFVLASLPWLVSQAIVNFSATGSLLGMGYKMQKGVEANIPMVSFKYPLNFILYPLRYSPFLLLPLAAGLAILALGVYKIIKENKIKGWLLTSYTIFLGGPLLLVEASMRNPRYFLSIIPALLIFFVAGSEYLVKIAYLNLWKKQRKLNTA